jgi:hypothetical protein
VLTDLQQVRLKSVARSTNHPLFGYVNEALDNVIDNIKQENPLAFLPRDQLMDRVFFDEPLQNIPFKSFIKRYVPRILTMRREK